MNAVTTNEIDTCAGPAIFSSREFRNAMGMFASGVVVITVTTNEGIAHAMTANAFMSGSLEPPLVVVSVAITAKMHSILEEAPVFGISILSSAQEKDSNHFAGRRSPDHDPILEELTGIPVLAGAAVCVAADRLHSYACGDHTLFVGQVRALETRASEEDRPLVFFRGKYGALAS